MWEVGGILVCIIVGFVGNGGLSRRFIRGMVCF